MPDFIHILPDKPYTPRNSRRLQNMILTVGPGTPASCILPSAECNSDSSEGSFSDSEDSERENDGDASQEDRSEGQEGVDVLDEPSTDGYRFDSDRGRLVVGEATAATATTDTAAENETAAQAGTARHLDARVTPSTDSGHQVNSSDDEGESAEPSGRTHWERRQETVRNALMGNESEEEDDDDSSSSRPLFNIERVEQYLSHIESIQRRRERGLSLSSPARDRGTFNPEANVSAGRGVGSTMLRIVISSMHGGCCCLDVRARDRAVDETWRMYQHRWVVFAFGSASSCPCQTFASATSSILARQRMADLLSRCFILLGQ